MTLFEFIEHFDKETDIVVRYYGNMEYRGKVCKISLEYLKNR